MASLVSICASFFLQVIVPKRSQSSQDMGQLQHRSAKATPSLASTPEKDTDPSEDADNEQKASLQGAGQASNGQTQKAGGLGWGVMSRVASGLLGSGSKKSVPDKKVSCAVLPPQRCTSCNILSSQNMPLTVDLRSVHLWLCVTWLKKAMARVMQMAEVGKRPGNGKHQSLM